MRGGQWNNLVCGRFGKGHARQAGGEKKRYKIRQLHHKRNIKITGLPS